MKGWGFFCILTQTSFFSESESLCNAEDAIAEVAREEFEAFFSPLFSATTIAASVGNSMSKSLW